MFFQLVIQGFRLLPFGLQPPAPPTIVIFPFSRRMEKHVTQKAHLHFKLLGQEATYHLLQLMRTSHKALLNARGLGELAWGRVAASPQPYTMEGA